MNRSEKIPVITVSGLLLLYIFLRATSYLPGIAGFIYSVSPLLVAWLVYNVIRLGKKNGEELKQDDEWGYADKAREDLDMF